MQQVPTFAKANETVLAIHAEHWKSERTKGQWRASMRDYVLPRLALAHVNSDRVEVAYRCSDLFDRRRVLNDWTAYVA